MAGFRGGARAASPQRAPPIASPGTASRASAASDALRVPCAGNSDAHHVRNSDGDHQKARHDRRHAQSSDDRPADDPHAENSDGDPQPERHDPRHARNSGDRPADDLHAGSAGDPQKARHDPRHARRADDRPADGLHAGSAGDPQPERHDRRHARSSDDRPGVDPHAGSAGDPQQARRDSGGLRNGRTAGNAVDRSERDARQTPDGWCSRLGDRRVRIEARDAVHRRCRSEAQDGRRSADRHAERHDPRCAEGSCDRCRGSGVRCGRPYAARSALRHLANRASARLPNVSCCRRAASRRARGHSLYRAATGAFRCRPS